jgi:hypothetical protein
MNNDARHYQAIPSDRDGLVELVNNLIECACLNGRQGGAERHVEDSAARRHDGEYARVRHVLVPIRKAAAEAGGLMRSHILFSFAPIFFGKMNIPVNTMTFDRIMSRLFMEAAFHNARGAYR